jgi:hypothetical protein
METKKTLTGLKKSKLKIYWVVELVLENSAKRWESTTTYKSERGAKSAAKRMAKIYGETDVN